MMLWKSILNSSGRLPTDCDALFITEHPAQLIRAKRNSTLSHSTEINPHGVA
jgi:hypothetical protein